MAAVSNDRGLLERLSDLSKVEESSIVKALNKAKEQAEKDRESAEDSYKDVQEQIEQKEEAKGKLEADIAKIEEILDETAFAPYEESLAVLGLSESLKKVLEQLKKAPETVQSMIDELTALNKKEEEFDTARTEADIKVSEIDKSLPSVISDLQGMAAFLQSALSNETGNITKNEITGRLENINKNCPEAFSAADMDRIAQLILFPDKLIEYFKMHQEVEAVLAEDEKRKGVGEVIAAAMEEANATEEMDHDMASELKAAGIDPDSLSADAKQFLSDHYQKGMISANTQILADNLIDYDAETNIIEILVTENLSEKIATILKKGKSVADIKASLSVLALPLEMIENADIATLPLWSLEEPHALATAQANEETLLNYDIALDEEDRKKYYPLMSFIPTQDFESNLALLKEYGISIIKKNKKPAIRIVAQPMACLQDKIDAYIEQGRIEEVLSSPEILAAQFEAPSLKASDVVQGDAVEKYEEAPEENNEEEIDLGLQVKYKEIINHLLDYVFIDKMEVDDFAYHVNGQAFSRKRVERNILRAVVAGIEDENMILQIAFSDGACAEEATLQGVFDTMEINVVPKEGFTQGGAKE